MHTTGRDRSDAQQETNRYQRGSDAGATAGWRDTAADRPGSEASTRAGANWDSSAASQSEDIPYRLYLAIAV